MALCLCAAQEIEVADAADAAAHKEASEDIRKYSVKRLTPVLIVCECLAQQRPYRGLNGGWVDRVASWAAQQ
jgi:hypothetical protein